MKIFNWTGTKLELNKEQIFLIPEFKEVLKRDKTKDKSKTFNIFTYIYLRYDFGSPYRDYPVDKRQSLSLEAARLEEDFQEEAYIQDAVEKYKEILESNPVINIIKASFTLLEKVQNYADTVDLTEKIDQGAHKGKLVHSVREVRETIKQMPELVTRAKEIRDLLEEEMEESSDVRGSGELGIFNEDFA